MSKFKIGDRVIVRQFDDMGQEFGVNRFREITCRFAFTESMKYLCGKIGTITDVSYSGNHSISFDDETDASYWSISEDMLELIDNSQDESIVPLCDKIKFEDIL